MDRDEENKAISAEYRVKSTTSNSNKQIFASTRCDKFQPLAKFNTLSDNKDYFQ